MVTALDDRTVYKTTSMTPDREESNFPMQGDNDHSEKAAKAMAFLPLAIMIGVLLVVIVGIVIYVST